MNFDRTYAMQFTNCSQRKQSLCHFKIGVLTSYILIAQTHSKFVNAFKLNIVTHILNLFYNTAIFCSCFPLDGLVVYMIHIHQVASYLLVSYVCTYIKGNY